MLLREILPSKLESGKK